MRRRHDSDIETPDYDSFLDIVANLVGILIILIMVLGVRAKDAWEHADTLPSAVAVVDPASDEPSNKNVPSSTTLGQETDLSIVTAPSPTDEGRNGFVLPPLNLDITANEPPSNPGPPILAAADSADPQMPDVEAPRRQAADMRLASHEIDQQVAALDRRVAVQKAYRNELLVALASGQQQIAEHRENLATVSSERSVDHQKVVAAKEQLANLQRQVDTFDRSKPAPIVLTHRPAPMAQTVFGHEEHFRLHKGLLSYVPMREITDLLQSEMKNKMWKLEETPQIKETTGPVGNFSVRYMLTRTKRKVPTEAGMLLRTVVELDHFELMPVNQTFGVPVSVALSTGSEFSQRLSRYEPNEVTVTIWTYPDSYAELRQFKESLWQRGFLVAARPLAENTLIGGSPDGSRSAAE